MKTEPETFSWDNLVEQGAAMWDGVRNYQARNNIRAMKFGDIVFIYHSVTNPGIVGLAKIITEHYPDPTAKEGDWSVVDVSPLRKLKRFIPLGELKQNPELQDMWLLRNPRLSVQAVTTLQFQTILKMEEEG